jgi:hypothetical protein
VLTAEGLLTYLGPTGWFNRILIALRFVNPTQLVAQIKEEPDH